MEGITCDFQARRGRRDFSGHSELRLLRSHSLAGHTSQPNLKLCSCWLSQNSPDTQTAGHTFQEPLPGVYSQARVPGFWEGLVQAWLFNGLFKLYTRVTWKTGRIEVPSNAQSLGLIRLEGRQLLCLQDQLTGRNTTQGALRWLRRDTLRGAPTSQALAEHRAPGGTRPGLGCSRWAPTASPAPRARRGPPTAERGRRAAGCGGRSSC